MSVNRFTFIPGATSERTPGHGEGMKHGPVFSTNRNLTQRKPKYVRYFAL